MTITIQGASDDGVIVRSDAGDSIPPAEEYDVYGGLWRADLIAPWGDAMRVHAIYINDDGDGAWHIAVGQVDESMPLPGWPLRIVQSDRPYSVAVHIDAPAGTRLDNIASKEL